MFKLHAIAAAALCAAAAVPSLAATATVNVTLDVADIEPGKNGFTGGVQGTPPFGPPFSVTLAEGDTFDFKIDFVGSQTLTIKNLSLIWAFSYADVGSYVTGTGSLSLLDASGAVLYSSVTKTDTEGQAHFGQFFFASEFPGLPSSVTFGGLHYVGTVDDYVDPLVTTRTYNNPALYFNTNNVPEPSTWALMSAGLVLCAAAARRRARAV